MDIVTQIATPQERVVTRRFRVCQHCQVRFTTVETLEDDDKPGVPATWDPGPTLLTPQEGVKKKRKNPFMR